MLTTPIFNMHDVVLIVTIAASFVLALSQPIVPLNSRLTKALLALFFLSLTISNLAIILIWNEYIDKSPTIMRLTPYFYVGALLIKGPALHFYVRSITEQQFTLRPLHAVHLIPFVAIFFVIAVFGIDIGAMRADTPGMERGLRYAVESVWYAVKLIPLGYFVSALVRAFRYHKRAKEQYSNVDESSLVWLYSLTIGFVLTGLWTLAVSILGYLYRWPLGVTDNYLSFALLVALFYYSVSHARNLTPAKRVSEQKETVTKPLDTIIQKIIDGVEVDKLHLNHALNIEQFSQHIGLSAREVSYTINKSFGTNFFEFINSYRVEEAKRLLRSKNHEQQTVMEILLNSGFNSKSAFQRFFKRLTDMSPTEYRAQAMGKDQ